MCRLGFRRYLESGLVHPRGMSMGSFSQIAAGNLAWFSDGPIGPPLPLSPSDIPIGPSENQATGNRA